MNLSNPILNIDSYKLSHHLLYPPGTQAISASIEARGHSLRPEVVFFGLQMFLKEYLSKPVTRADIEEAAEVAYLHGLPFNRDGWERIVGRFGGYLPVRIEALPEGSVVNRGVPLVQVVNTDPMSPWLTSYLDTALLRAVWYPSTVASNVRATKAVIMPYLEKTCEDPAAAARLRLYDFGARGATSREQAGLGGAAHLIHFQSTDNLAGVLYARTCYNAAMAGFSIPASEHSTMTAWGQQRETEAFAHMVDRFAPGGAYSVVSDSYDINNAVSEIWGRQLQEKVVQAGGMLLVRPDSGDPIDTPVGVLSQLAYAYGTTLNARGYRVVNGNVRVLQGDGIGSREIGLILGRMEALGFSAENMYFGMGSSLLQKTTRDAYSFAMKANALQDESGVWHDIAKRPALMREKASPAGRRAAVRSFNDILGIRLDALGHRDNLLVPVWDTGELLVDHSFDAIRRRAGL